MTEASFGHQAINLGGAHIDTWGAGPFTIRIGRRRYYFTDSDMFGPLLESKDGRVLESQPILPAHSFWMPYHMWRAGGRKGKKVGRWIVCQWRVARAGQYWTDEKGAKHFVVMPEHDSAGYIEVDRP
jgi:hypothetical protein